MGEIEAEQGTDNKLYRAYGRKIDRYKDLLEDGSDEDSVMQGSAGDVSLDDDAGSAAQAQDIQSVDDAEEEHHDEESGSDDELSEPEEEHEEEAPKKKKKKKKVSEGDEEAPKKKVRIIARFLGCTVSSSYTFPRPKEKEEEASGGRGSGQEKEGKIVLVTV